MLLLPGSVYPGTTSGPVCRYTGSNVGELTGVIGAGDTGAVIGGAAPRRLTSIPAIVGKSEREGWNKIVSCPSLTTAETALVTAVLGAVMLKMSKLERRLFLACTLNTRFPVVVKLPLKREVSNTTNNRQQQNARPATYNVSERWSTIS
jgi:hypothetical protein